MEYASDASEQAEREAILRPVRLYMEASPQPFLCAERLDYTLTAANYQEEDVQEAVLGVTLPPEAVFGEDAYVAFDGQAPQPITPECMAPLTFRVAEIPADRAVHIQFSAHLPGVTPGSTLISRAALSYAGFDGEPITVSYTAVYSCAKLQAVLTAPEKIRCGEGFAYVLTVYNEGDKPALVKNLTDKLEGGLCVRQTDVAISGHGGTPRIALSAENVLTIADFTVAPKQTVTITIPVTYGCAFS